MESFRTDLDLLIDILRANPEQTFSYDKLSRLTSMTIPSIKKWTNLLELRGDVKIEYRLSEDAISWIGDTFEKKDEDSVYRQEYREEDLKSQIKDMLESIQQTKERIASLKEKREMLILENPDSPILKMYSDMLIDERVRLTGILKDAQKLRYFIKKKNEFSL